ncbi:MAG: hypothetical protein ACRDGQ_11770, partial [Candidatus Limnocylindrales bacterium]
MEVSRGGESVGLSRPLQQPADPAGSSWFVDDACIRGRREPQHHRHSVTGSPVRTITLDQVGGADLVDWASGAGFGRADPY